MNEEATFAPIGKRVDPLLYTELNKRQSCVTGGLAESVRADLG